MAHRTLVAAGMALAALAACSEPQGTGFSGISSEAQTVTSASISPTALPTASASGLPYAYLDQDVPQITARSRATNEHLQAEEAILIADKKNQVSQKIFLNNQEMRFSVVWVNQKPFAVVRPAKNSVRLQASGSSAFHANVHGLTNCPPVSGVYTHDKNGGRDGITGMAVAMGCITG